jgi:hypothetical protein
MIRYDQRVRSSRLRSEHGVAHARALLRYWVCAMRAAWSSEVTRAHVGEDDGVGREEITNRCAHQRHDWEIRGVGMPSARAFGGHSIPLVCVLLAGLWISPPADARRFVQTPRPSSIGVGTSSISGAVESSGGGYIPHDEVCAIKVDGEGEPEGGLCTLSAQTGQYEFRDLPAGEYKVEFSGNECSPEPRECAHDSVLQFYNDKPSLLEANRISLASGEALTNVDARVAFGGNISGSVLVDSIKPSPISETLVCAIQQLGGETEIPTCSITNVLGAYTLDDLAPGSAYVIFTGEVCSSSSESCTEEYRPQYYEGSVRFAEARPVNVTNGSTTSGISAALNELYPQTPSNSALPALSGGPFSGSELDCSEGEWLHNPTKLEYVWKLEGAPITSQTSSSLQIASVYEGRRLTCEVIASNSAGSAHAESAAMFIPISSPSPATGPSGSSAETTSSMQPTIATTNSTPPSSPVAVVAVVSTSATRVVLKGTFLEVPVSCLGAACTGTAQLVSETVFKTKHGKKVTRVVLASGRYTIAAGRSEMVELHLSHAGETKLASARHYHLVETLHLIMQGSVKVARSVTVTLPR